eukprot:jgi/Ulvmu1/9118/UM005_0213.1
MEKPAPPSEVSEASMPSIIVEAAPENQRKMLSWKSAAKIVIIIGIVAGIVLGLTVGDLDRHIGALLEWLDDNRVEGIAIFIGIYAALTGVFFPSSLLTLAGGAIYGFAGIPMVWFGACLGQTLSFFLSRYLLHSWVQGWGNKYAVWNGINAAITQHALKIVILIRLATIIPYSVTNALLPITELGFKEYTIGSAIGILPGVCLYVAIGRLASSIAQVVNGDVDTDPRILIVSVAVSIVFLVIVVVILTRYAKKSLAQKIDVAVEEQPQAQSEAAEPGSEAPAEAEVGIQMAAGGSTAPDVAPEAVPADAAIRAEAPAVTDAV